MDPFTVSTHISLPREEVFEYLADIANHAEFTDHYLVDWRLTREQSYGEGAGARFKVKVPLNGRFSWADVTLSEVSAPFKIVERGRGGKYNRVKSIGVYEIFEGAGPGTCRVEFTYQTDAHVPSDLIPEILGGRGWAKRKAHKAMKRLRAILEEDRLRGTRPTVAAR